MRRGAHRHCNGRIALREGKAAMNESPRPTQVLVVDDERNLCWTLRGILEDEGFGVTVAVSAMAALKAAMDKSCEIVFIGSRLPGVNAITLARLIQHLRPETLCILIRSASREDDRTGREGPEQGAICGAISKPFRTNEILSVVHAAVANPRS